MKIADLNKTSVPLTVRLPDGTQINIKYRPRVLTVEIIERMAGLRDTSEFAPTVLAETVSNLLEWIDVQDEKGKDVPVSKDLIRDNFSIYDLRAIYGQINKNMVPKEVNDEP